MITEKYNAIVLLGYHNIGKDTLANRLVEEYPQFVNTKFSALSKLLIYTATGVDCNDKKARELPIGLNNINTNLSAIQLLNALFLASNHEPSLAKANIEFAINSISKGKIPVFTDVRRVAEMQAVSAHFIPLVIVLYDKDVKPGESDEQIDNVKATIPSFDVMRLHTHRGGEQSAYSWLLEYLKSRNLLPVDARQMFGKYTHDLLTLNSKHFPVSRESQKELIAHFGFGLVEELTEFFIAHAGDRIAEAGDVMAYLVLLLVAYGYSSSSIEQQADYVSYMLVESNTVNSLKGSHSRFTQVLLDLSGNLKRYFRENSAIPLESILRAFVWMSDYLNSSEIDMKEVLAYSIEKLTKRASTGNLFQGSGSHR